MAGIRAVSGFGSERSDQEVADRPARSGVLLHCGNRRKVSGATEVSGFAWLRTYL